MEAVNYSTKTVIVCLPRIGSMFLERRINMTKTNWNYIGGETLEELENNGYNILGIVRHPVPRFLSWFHDFVVVNKSRNMMHKPINALPRNWTMSDIDDFADGFKTSMHYDTHTQYQKYYWLNSGLNTVKYVELEKLNSLFGIDRAVKSIPKWEMFSASVKQDIIEYINHVATELYKEDIVWYNSIKK